MAIFETVEIEFQEEREVVIARLREHIQRAHFPRRRCLAGRVQDATFSLTLLHPLINTFVVARGSVEERSGATILRAQVRPSLPTLALGGTLWLMSSVGTVVLFLQGRPDDAVWMLATAALFVAAPLLMFRRYVPQAVGLLEEAAHGTS